MRWNSHGTTFDIQGRSSRKKELVRASTTGSSIVLRPVKGKHPIYQTTRKQQIPARTNLSTSFRRKRKLSLHQETSFSNTLWRSSSSPVRHLDRSRRSLFLCQMSNLNHKRRTSSSFVALKYVSVRYLGKIIEFRVQLGWFGHPGFQRYSKMADRQRQRRSCSTRGFPAKTELGPRPPRHLLPQERRMFEVFAVQLLGDDSCGIQCRGNHLGKTA